MSCSAGSPLLKADKYIICYPEDQYSEKWADYLFYHLQKRTNFKDILIMDRIDHDPKTVTKGASRIYFEVAPELGDDFRIENFTNRFKISVKDERTALWIVYQLISRMSIVDSRFISDDLLYPILDFRSISSNFDFDYREPHFAPNAQEYYASIMGNNCIDTDWGLWGHNLHKVAEGVDDERIYALVDGKRDHSQYCFSSTALFHAMESYVIDNYGFGNEDPVYFMIAPNDNDLVCICPTCRQLGNSEGYSTPAVQDFIRRIAERFPKHHFFLPAYRTTHRVGKYYLPDNAGVFFSTIDLPAGSSLQDCPEFENLKMRLVDWREKTPNLYLWVYSSNFDDYLTPMPLLHWYQERLQGYKILGVKGIFMNGSSYDYSSFDDVKTYVASALMKNVDSDVDVLVADFFKDRYPVAHTLLTDYYLGLESDYAIDRKPIDIYGGFEKSSSTYFNWDKFITFYNELAVKVSAASGEEKENLGKLLVSLTYPMLQIKYFKGSGKGGFFSIADGQVKTDAETDSLIALLSGHSKYEDMANYKETDGKIDDYLAGWKSMLESGNLFNAASGKTVRVPEGDNGKLLTDGVPGFANDYHQGWYIPASGNLHASLATDGLRNGTSVASGKPAAMLELRFLVMEKHRFFEPSAIELKVDGKEVAINPVRSVAFEDGKSSVIVYSIPVDLGERLEVSAFRKEGSRTSVACDEIRILL